MESNQRALRTIPVAELAAHNSPKSCWMALNGIVYDLTEFLSQHPGGGAILLKHSGKDATSVLKAYHPADIVQMLPQSAAVGRFIPVSSTVSDSTVAPKAIANIPLGHILNTYDFARNARTRLSKEAWDYLISAADDEVTYRANESSFNSVWIKPRVLVDVSGQIDTSVSLLGSRCTAPIMISPAAMGRLYHPDGEMALARGAMRAGIIQMCPTLASCSIGEMAHARGANQTQWYQLYVNTDRRVTENVVRKAEALGLKALVVTVDVAVLGKRERDQRNKVSDISNVQKSVDANADRSQGVSKSLSSFIYPGLDWDQLKWIRSITKLPILLKGIQTKEDALLAVRSRLVQGIIVSNHGGRQVDFARPTVDCLSEITRALRSERGVNLNVNFDVYVDGGIRRGTDILKCLAIGAKAVGVGRPAIFALASHGAEGVHHLIDMLTEELKIAMMHTGCRRISDINDSIISDSSTGPRAVMRFEPSKHESKL